MDRYNIHEIENDRDQLMKERASKPGHINALSIRGIRPLREPVKIMGKFDNVSLDNSYITGWKLSDNNLVLAIELPGTNQKVEINKQTDFTITIPIAPGVNPRVDVTGKALYETELTDSDEEGTKDEYLEMQLTNIEPGIKDTLKNTFIELSHSEEVVRRSREAVIPEIKSWQRTIGAIILTAAAVVGIKAFRERDVPAENLCHSISEGRVPERKPGYLRMHLRTTDPAEIVGTCRNRFGLVVQLEDAKKLVEKAGVIEKK